MSAFKRLTACIAILTPLMLTGCGDGWVAQKYKGVPYDGRGLDDDDRTAGYGVEYVRASMMPSKGVNTEIPVQKPVEEKPAEPQPAPLPEHQPAASEIKDAAPLFNKVQTK